MFTYLLFALECESMGDFVGASKWADKYIASTFRACYEADWTLQCAGTSASRFVPWQRQTYLPWEEARTIMVPATCNSRPSLTCDNSEWEP